MANINKQAVKFAMENVLKDGNFYLENSALSDTGMVVSSIFEFGQDDNDCDNQFVISFEIGENEELDDMSVYTTERVVECRQVG